MKKEDVKGLYHLGSANWYDSFKVLWNKLVANKAEKELTNFLLNNLNKNKNVLELGCGTALNLEKIYSLKLKFKRYLGFDFSSDMLKIAKRKFKGNSLVQFKEKDVTKLNDVKAKFDIIICTWVLSHLDSPSNFVNNAQKLLNKNGKMFIIFFSEPKWYLSFWFSPLSRLVFRANNVPNKEVVKFNNVKKIQKSPMSIVTVVNIWK